MPFKIFFFLILMLTLLAGGSSSGLENEEDNEGSKTVIHISPRDTETFVSEVAEDNEYLVLIGKKYAHANGYKPIKTKECISMLLERNREITLKLSSLPSTNLEKNKWTLTVMVPSAKGSKPFLDIPLILITEND